MQRNIELELRAEVRKEEYNKLLSQLKKEYKLISHTKRLSVMYFGKIGGVPIDIRVRITNGKAEVVVKKGSLHAHDRIELSQPINRSQFIGMVRLYSLFGFQTEVAERETYNFAMGRGVVFSLVKAGNIAYVEVEKMSGKLEVEKNKQQLLKILDTFKLKPIIRQKEFDKLCKRLSKYSDWSFNGSKRDLMRLRRLLMKYY